MKRVLVFLCMLLFVMLLSWVIASISLHNMGYALGFVAFCATVFVIWQAAGDWTK